MAKRLYSIAHIPVGILEPDGEVLVGAGWQELCVNFHRVHPDTAERCRQSDQYIKEHLDVSAPLEYRCRNGLWDFALPVLLDGRHIATLFLGQFRLEGETPDREFFRRQAEEFGFPQEEYLAALDKLPAFTRARIHEMMGYYHQLLGMLVAGGAARWKQKHQREALRQSEQRLSLAVEAANAGIWDWNPKSGEVYFSPRYYTMLGYAPNEFPASFPNWADRVHPEDIARCRRILREHFERKKSRFEMEFRMRTKDGDWRWILARGNVVETDGQGEAVRMAGTHVDITQRKQVENALRESRQRLQTVIAHAPLILWAIDRDGVFQFSEGSGLEQLGLQPGELVGRSLFEVYADRLDVCELTREVLDGKPVHGRCQDGGHQFEVHYSPLTDDQQGVAGAIGVALDISERVRAEQEREQLQSQLRQMQKMEAIGQLAGGIAHDFNNILQAISGYTQLTLSSIYEENPARDNLLEIENATGRAISLVRQLLTFSRQQTTKLSLQDLNEIVRSQAGMLRRLLGEDIELHVQTGRHLPMVRVAAGQIEQILTNLCINARDAMPDGGRLEICSGLSEFENAYCRTHPWARPGRYVWLQVTDSGAGMTEEIREHVFEPFFTTKPTGKGTGLGLSMVYGIVQQHHGLIQVQSAPGEGSEFTIYLPPSKESATYENDLVRREVANGQNELVLLAEDDEAVRKLTVTYLAKAGYRVLQAVDGQDAVEQFQAQPDQIALAILDIVMPRCGGVDAMQAIREQRPDMPVLFCSGYSKDTLPGSCLPPNCQLLPKPYLPTELLSAVQGLLRLGSRTASQE